MSNKPQLSNDLILGIESYKKESVSKYADILIERLNGCFIEKTASFREWYKFFEYDMSNYVKESKRILNSYNTTSLAINELVNHNGIITKDYIVPIDILVDLSLKSEKEKGQKTRDW